MKQQKNRTIILPIGEKEYHQIIDNNLLFLKKMTVLIELYPELFPHNICNGFSFVGFSKNEVKLSVKRRIIRLKTDFNSYDDYLIHPCFIFPYLRGNTKDISRGLLLRKYNTPYHAIATTLGKNAMYWYRAEVTLCQYNIVGTTIKSASKLPENILADEHHTRLISDKIYICTTVGNNCFLGASIAPSMHYENLKKAYGIFKSEVQIICPEYEPVSINMDGYKSTKKAIADLYPSSGILRCFLHSFLKIRNCGTKAYSLYFEEVTQRVWSCYHAKSKQAFAQKITNLHIWAEQIIPNSAFKNSVLKLCEKKRIFNAL